MSNVKTNKWYQKTWVLVLGGLVGLGIVGNMISPKPKIKEEITANSAESKLIDEMAEKVIKETSTNSDKLLQQAKTAAKLLLKQNLKDDDSYEEVQRTASFQQNKKKQEVIQVFIKYRAKNSFGAKVLQSQCFDFSLSGALIETYKCN